MGLAKDNMQSFAEKAKPNKMVGGYHVDNLETASQMVVHVLKRLDPHRAIGRSAWSDLCSMVRFHPRRHSSRLHLVSQTLIVEGAEGDSSQMGSPTFLIWAGTIPWARARNRP